MSVILDLMIHDLQILHALDPSPVAEVRATGIAVLSPRVDIANARVALSSGCVANVTASRVSAERVRKLRAFLPSRYYSLDYHAQEIHGYRLVDSDDGRRILQFMNSDSSVGWNAITPPDVPADRVAALRNAFDATVLDPDFLADAQKQGLEIVPGRGDEVREVVEHTLATPPELVARIAAIIGGQN